MWYKLNTLFLFVLNVLHYTCYTYSRKGNVNIYKRVLSKIVNALSQNDVRLFY